MAIFIAVASIPYFGLKLTGAWWTKIKEYKAKYPKEADALEKILSWKDVDEMFELAHFIGVTRPAHIAEHHAALALQSIECLRVGGVTPVTVRDGNGENLSTHVAAGEQTIGILHPQP